MTDTAACFRCGHPASDHYDDTRAMNRGCHLCECRAPIGRQPTTAADQRECQTCGYDPANHKREAHLYDPHPFCLTCPDHEACSQGASCWKVKEVNGVR